MGRLKKVVNTTRKRFSALVPWSRGSQWKWLAVRVVVCCLAAVTQAQSATEYQVKAAFLFNFARFVEWPADAFPGVDAPLQICLLGHDPFGREFEEVIGDKSVNGHRIEVIHPSGVPQARGCQIIFVSSSEEKQTLEILRGLRGATVLTSATPPYNSSVLLVPTFSGGTAVIGSTGVGSSDITSSAVNGGSYPTPLLTSPKTFTLTVTDSKGNVVFTTCLVTPSAVSYLRPKGNLGYW